MTEKWTALAAQQSKGSVRSEYLLWFRGKKKRSDINERDGQGVEAYRTDGD